MSSFTESDVKDAALAWLKAVGRQVVHGPGIAPNMPAAERRDFGEAVLTQRLRNGLERLKTQLPAEALDDAFRKLTQPEGAAHPSQPRPAPPTGGWRSGGVPRCRGLRLLLICPRLVASICSPRCTFPLTPI